jgi:O-antigen biosynthesis alpha-1,3-mannosyltransferase
MIIAYDVSHIQVQRGGIGRFSLTLLQGLLECDHVNRYVLHGWSASLDRAALAALSAGNVDLRIAGIPGPIKRAYWDTLRTISVEAFVGRCDVFHSSDAFAPPCRGAKLIVTVYDLLSLSMPGMFPHWVKRRDRRMDRSLRHADAVIVPSQWTRDRLRESGMVDERRISVITPVLPECFDPHAGETDRRALTSLGLERPYILAVGTIEPRKNIPLLLRAFQALTSAEAGDIDLVIAGKRGWMMDDLREQAKEPKLRPRIKMLSYVPEGLLPALYRHAMCFVYPSLAEGFGLPVAEAMASGTPVITSASSALEEIGHGSAELIDPHSERELLAALRRVLSSKEHRQDLRHRGLQRAAELRAQQSPEKVMRLYSEVVGR